MQQFETYLRLPNDWQKEIEKANLNLGLDQPIKEIFKQIKSKVNIYPSLENIYKAFELCSYKKTKVVIFGQDPYHQNGFANGLAFAVNKGLKIPPSLKNISSKYIRSGLNLGKFERIVQYCPFTIDILL